MILLFKILVFRSRKTANKNRLILRVKKEVEVEMIRDYRSRGGSRHGIKGKGFVEKL
jgi:hypothetical protein